MKPQSTGYSATVDIYMIVDDRKIPARSIGSNSITLEHGMNLAPGTEVIVASVVDGVVKSNAVVLPHGATESEPQITYW